AWLDTGTGTLWADGDTVSLTVPDDALESGSIRPVFRDNGDRAVLTEVGTGLIWTAPDGRLVPLEQWAVEKETEQEEGTVVVEDVAEQLPPVAVDNAFGVRSGQQVILPVLYNDHDPNKKDVLSIDPASLGGLADPDFGDLALVANGQSLVVTVRAASGQTSFSYAVTDGSAV
ncbi:Ig-like domain-containing protein, partial [Sphingobium sp. ZW T5_29]